MKNYVDYRDYGKEARALIKDLSTNELYRLYEIVIEQQKTRQSDTRRKELDAVQTVIEGQRNLDKFRLDRIKNGYRSEMANSAKAKDGNTRPNRKRV